VLELELLDKEVTAEDEEDADILDGLSTTVSVNVYIVYKGNDLGLETNIIIGYIPICDTKVGENVSVLPVNLTNE
jgi:hypothetical protein